MTARYTLHRPDGSLAETWTDTPGWQVLRQVRRRARRGQLTPGSELRSAGRTVATWDQIAG